MDDKINPRVDEIIKAAIAGAAQETTIADRLVVPEVAVLQAWRSAPRTKADQRAVARDLKGVFVQIAQIVTTLYGRLDPNMGPEGWRAHQMAGALCHQITKDFFPGATDPEGDG